MSYDFLPELHFEVPTGLQNPDVIKVYHRTSPRSKDRQCASALTSAMLLGACSPYIKALAEADNTPMRRVTILGGNFNTVRNILFWIERFSENPSALPKVSNPEVLGYCQLHEAAKILEIDYLVKLAMHEIELILANPLHPTNVYAVLNRYKGGQYVDAMRENLAHTLLKWYGEEYVSCKFATYLGEKFPEFWAEVRRINETELSVQKLLAEKQQEREEERQNVREAPACIQQGATTAADGRFEQAGRPPVAAQLAAPVRQALPLEGKAWAAVAARVHAASQAPANPTTQLHPATASAAATTTHRVGTNATPTAVSKGRSWADVARGV